MTDCPQCGTPNNEEAKNCASCRINLYWATRHYGELARLRQASLLVPHADTARFLLESSRRVDQGPVANWLRRVIAKARS
jgi:hypothetical protein